MKKLKIESEGGTGANTRVWLDEREITNGTCALSIDMEVGQPNRATFTVYFDKLELEGDFDPELIKANGRERTSFASRFREWLGA